jgi:ferric-dicitrate binding protein FerR (iron transport regulator)
MEPGMQVAYSKGTGETEYKKVDTHLFTSWKDGYYEFEEMELGELMPLLGRWYAVGVDFEEPELKRLKFSGRLQRYETVADLVKMLEYTGDVVFEVKNDRILVRKR